MKKHTLGILLLAAACTAAPPDPYGPLPTPGQVRWQRMEMNMFCHFGPNTFSGAEWGSGVEPEDLFAPSSLDCRQWARTAAAAGFKGIIVTAKHHDGFCLWPNPESSHTVARSGAPDVLRELSAACREYGLGFGVYISPWDRNDPAYGSPEYNLKYARTLRSVLDGSYGPVFELWFDGACGEGPGGRRQEYDWPLFRSTVRSLQSGTIMFSDTGPGARWVGNEDGYAATTCWSTLDTAGFTPGAGAPPQDTLGRGNVHGRAWVPAEADVSIRPGWFWHAEETPELKSAEALFDIYLGSVGRNSLMLLNVPPDTLGRIDPADSLRLMEFKALRDSVFAVNLAAGARVRASASRRGYGPRHLVAGNPDSYWAAPDGDLTPCLELRLPMPATVGYVVLQEYIPLGQRVASFEVEVHSDGAWRHFASGTTVGCKRILTAPPVRADRIRIRILSSLASPVLSAVEVY